MADNPTQTMKRKIRKQQRELDEAKRELEQVKQRLQWLQRKDLPYGGAEATDYVIVDSPFEEEAYLIPTDED